MPKKKKNNHSASSVLKVLLGENFFAKPRNLKEVQIELASKGYHFTSPALSSTLIRLVRSGTLSRSRMNGKWAYILKAHPSLSVEKVISAEYIIHPRIKEVAWKQFESGHYKEAIQNALVEVVDQVKIKTNYPKNAGNGRDLDGDDLMNKIFGCDNQTPVIKFNSLSTSLEKAEQRGIMNLFKGIVGIRDKKAHLNFIQKDHNKTIEYLGLASLLLRLLDENPPS